MTNTTDTNSTPRVLTNSRAFARCLLERFSESHLGATGAILLGEDSTLLGILILEPANLTALPAALAGATAQIVPFLFRTGWDPMLTDEAIELFCGLLEATDVTVLDCLYVWDTGHYLARANAGELACVYDTEGKRDERCRPA